MLSRSFMTPDSNKSLLAYTPMLHARMFSETPKFREAHFQPLHEPLISHSSSSTPHEPSSLFLDGNPSLDRPLFVQFCANDPGELLHAAKYVSPFCDAVDLNLGCPQGIARKGKYGAFLQEDQTLIYNLINKLHNELDVPITAKIRILDTREKTLEYAQMVLKAGASILTVHGRTREMKGHKTGLADWSVLRYLRENLPRDTVIFANGNILKREDIDKCLEETGADGVMSAEGNLYDPAIFAEAPGKGMEGREYWRGKDGEGGWRMDAVLRRYLDIIHTHVLRTSPPPRKPLYLPSDPIPAPADEMNINGKREQERGEEEPAKKKQKKGEKKEKTTSPNLIAMQAHCFKLLRALVGKHTHIRDALARSRAGDVDAFENVLQMVEKVVGEGIREYIETEGGSYEEELERDERFKAAKAKEVSGKGIEKELDKAEMDESSVETVKNCKRPWWVVQPYVRPLPKEALQKGSLTLSKKEKAKLESSVTALKDENGKGKVEKEILGNGNGDVDENREREIVEIPKEGLVCG